MPSESQVEELVARWERAQAEGQSLTITELCIDHPELESELARRVEQLSRERQLGETRAEHSDSSVSQFGAAPPSIVAKPIPPPEFPGYVIDGELGRGGMGVVYKARQSGLNRIVALKTLLAGAHVSPRDRARFYAEAEAVALLHHVNIVQIYEIAEHAGVPYFSLEYVGGGGLNKRIVARGLPPLDAARIMAQVARAIHYAHTQGVVHRDLKPANILLTGTPEMPVSEAEPKITDFGLAKNLEADARLTRTGTVLGTPYYMAPEQVEGRTERIGPLTDVYSLGVVLYEVLLGLVPFSGKSDFETMQRIVSDQPQPPCERSQDVPRELSDIVMHCLAKQPESRYPSAEALADDLEAFLIANGGEELLHRPGSRSGPRPRLPSNSGTSWHAQRRPWWQDRRMARRSFVSVAIAAMAIIACGLAWWANRNRETLDNLPADGGSAAVAAAPTGEPIHVGVLGSLSGALRITEEPVVDAMEMAIEELNAEGGLLGRPLEPILADGASSPQRYAEQAEKLAGHDHVPVIFSCGTSACRKAMVPVIEAHNGLLFYATQSEGLEQSPNVVYTGAAPNQQILPAVKWCYASLDKRRYFLVGSDYVFPHAANAIMKDELKKLGGEVVGERYIPLSGRGIDDVVREIVAAKPDVILNTINGEANIDFFAALREAGITPAEIPTFSFSISEQELRSMDLANMAGDYIAQTYFQSVESPENQAFLNRLWARYGRQRVATDSMESAYAGVKLWAKAVEAAGTFEPAAVREQLAKQHYAAPGGDLYLDPDTLNTYRVARIGQIQADGQLDIVYQSPRPLRPEPYPASRTREEWDAYLEGLHTAWGGNWHNPGQ